MKTEEIENALNELIAEAATSGGHVYVVDKKRNTFALRLKEPVKIHFFAGFKGDTENGGKQ